DGTKKARSCWRERRDCRRRQAPRGSGKRQKSACPYHHDAASRTLLSLRNDDHAVKAGRGYCETHFAVGLLEWYRLRIVGIGREITHRFHGCGELLANGRGKGR